MTVIKIEDVIKFGKNPATQKDRLEFNKKGVSFIEKIIGLNQKGYFDTEQLKDLNHPIAANKKGILLKLTMTETKEIVLKDNTKKSIRVDNYVFVDFDDKKIKQLSYHDVKEIVQGQEIESYR